MKKNIAPSLLAADFFDLSSQMKLLKEGNIKVLHLDVMDGMFVPSISFGMPVISSLRKSVDFFFDVHMMVENPERYIEDFYNSGADGITIHFEACKHIDRCISQIKSLGLRSGISINPATPVSLLENIISEVDMVLVMSVNPGFGGQKFIPYSLDKLRRLREMAEERDLELEIGVDGGIGLENIASVLDAGANFIIAGSSVFSEKDKITEKVEAFNRFIKP